MLRTPSANFENVTGAPVPTQRWLRLMAVMALVVVILISLSLALFGAPFFSAQAAGGLRVE